jgi:hypothetical protein
MQQPVKSDSFGVFYFLYSNNVTSFFYLQHRYHFCLVTYAMRRLAAFPAVAAKAWLRQLVSASNLFPSQENSMRTLPLQQLCPCSLATEATASSSIP